METTVGCRFPNDICRLGIQQNETCKNPVIKPHSILAFNMVGKASN